MTLLSVPLGNLFTSLPNKSEPSSLFSVCESSPEMAERVRRSFQIRLNLLDFGDLGLVTLKFLFELVTLRIAPFRI
jgi:hypothetical protein